jgi:hypothetical protein
MCESSERLCDTGLIRNDGFETGHFTGGWVVDNPSPIVSNALAHSGSYAAFAGGSLPLQFCGFGNETAGDSSFYQEFGPVPANATLSFWHWDCTTDSIDFDWQDAYITDQRQHSSNHLPSVWKLPILD